MDLLFDYRQIAEQLGIGQAELRKLEDVVRDQYALDEMMFELRMLRTLQAIDEGVITLPDAIAGFRGDPIHGSESRNARSTR